MKLKTLKDLRYFAMIVEPIKMLSGSTIKPSFIKTEEIKAEAIKWVKSDIRWMHMDDAFKKFFNLTEEDLA